MLKTLAIVILLLFSGVVCFGQSSFKGLMPGKSTKTDVERVLGRPVKQVSPTLVEYPPEQIRLKAKDKSISSGKIYVQYRDSSTAAVAERIEMILCFQTSSDRHDCDIVAMHDEFDPGLGLVGYGTEDAYIEIKKTNVLKFLRYMGSPRYMIRTDIVRSGPAESSEVRWAFYSRALYESVAPTGNCLGAFWGEWETNHGRMTITRTDVGKFRATYAENTGTVDGVIDSGLSGGWKDSTGSGTMYLLMEGFGPGKSFRGSWIRTSGTGPMKGQWEGKCIE